MKILLATPSYSATVGARYFLSITSLLQYFHRHHPAVEFRPVVLSNLAITEARNAFASLMLADKSLDYCLFIDDDMSFAPGAIERLINFKLPFLGCICPKRDFGFAKFHEAAQHIADPDELRNAAQEYVTFEPIFETGEDGRKIFYVRDGFTKVGAIGMGVTLIARSVFEAVASAHPELATEEVTGMYAGLGVKKIYNLFDLLSLPAGGRVSEDISFCRRWREGCGGEIWACVDEVIGHSGIHEFKGRLLDKIKLDHRLGRI